MIPSSFWLCGSWIMRPSQSLWFVCLFVCLLSPMSSRGFARNLRWVTSFMSISSNKSTTIWSTRYGCATWRKHLWLSKQNHENYNSGQRVKAIAAGMVYTSIAEGPCWLAEFTIEEPRVADKCQVYRGLLRIVLNFWPEWLVHCRVIGSLLTAKMDTVYSLKLT